jgi:predicted acyltransferase
MISQKIAQVSKLFYSSELGNRDPSVDVLRGFAIVGMIFVNHPPPTDRLLSPFVHAPIVGLHFADIVFPIFLFLVGVSISYTMGGADTRLSRVPVTKVFRRASLLIILSFLLVNFPYYDPKHIVITGTLFRIGVCYLATVFIAAYLSRSWQVGLVAAILATQWLLLTQWEIPEYGAGNFTVDGNASEYLDTVVFGDFTQRLKLVGPVTQGILPMLGSISSTMIGFVSGSLILSRRDVTKRQKPIVSSGVTFVVLGLLWATSYPVSKMLWTGSFVLLTSGIAMLLLGLFSFLISRNWVRVVSEPLRIAGLNALFFYVLAQCMQRVLVYGRLKDATGETVRFRYYIFDNWIEPLHLDKWGSFLYTVVLIYICYLLVWQL